MNSSDEYNNTPLITAARYKMISHHVEKVALLLRSGANINMYNKSDFNALTGHIDSQRNCVTKNVGMEMNMLLFAPGEIIENWWLEYVGDDQYIIGIEIHVPNYLLNTELKFWLKHLCREAIRKHLLHLDPHTHLFGRVPRLGLPSLLSTCCTTRHWMMIRMMMIGKHLPHLDPRTHLFGTVPKLGLP